MNNEQFRRQVLSDALAAGMPRATAELLARKCLDPVKRPEGQQRAFKASTVDDRALILADLKVLSLSTSLADSFLKAGHSHASARAALRDATRYPVESMPAWAARMGLHLVAARLKGARHAN